MKPAIFWWIMFVGSFITSRLMLIPWHKILFVAALVLFCLSFITWRVQNWYPSFLVLVSIYLRTYDKD